MIQFRFKALQLEDIFILQKWLREPHVLEFWPEIMTDDEIAAKYQKHIDSEFIFPYLIHLDSKPIGYIQAYSASQVGGGWWPNESIGSFGLDLYIGERELLNQGLGARILMEFMAHFEREQPVSQECLRWIIDVDPNNPRAIRCYEKAGFTLQGKVDTPDGRALFMTRIPDKISEKNSNNSSMISADLHKRIIEVHPEKGREWLEQFPQLVERFKVAWDLTHIEPLPNMSYNFVGRTTTSDRQRAIFKAGVPGSEIQNEISTLEAYRGNGCVSLIKKSPEDGVFLIEEALPGNTIASLSLTGKDEEAISIAASIIKKLHSNVHSRTPVLNSLDSLENRFSGFRRMMEVSKTGKSPFSCSLVEKASRIYEELLATTTSKILLHGDLHHFNILTSERNSYLAIDPQGVIGDPAFEVVAFMRNPIPEIPTLPGIKQILRNRIDSFSEILGFEKKRIWGWSFSQTLLSAWWVYEDHGTGHESWYNLSQILLELENEYW